MEGVACDDACGERSVFAPTQEASAYLAIDRARNVDEFDAAVDLLDVGAAGYAAKGARGTARKTALVSLATVAAFFVLDSLVARSVAQN